MLLVFCFCLVRFRDSWLAETSSLVWAAVGCLTKMERKGTQYILLLLAPSLPAILNQCHKPTSTHFIPKSLHLRPISFRLTPMLLNRNCKGIFTPSHATIIHLVPIIQLSFPESLLQPIIMRSSFQNKLMQNHMQ